MSDSLITSHAHLIPQLARRMKRSLPTADVRELESAGYFALVKAARAFEGRNGCKFSTYLFQRASGEMLNSFSRPEGKHARPELVPLDMRLASESPSPFDAAARSERRERAADALSGLSRKQLRAVRLVYGEERTVAEVAALWGVPYHRAYKVLRRALELARGRAAVRSGSRAGAFLASSFRSRVARL